jgi:hypothetical protein
MGRIAEIQRAREVRFFMKRLVTFLRQINEMNDDGVCVGGWHEQKGKGTSR